MKKTMIALVVVLGLAVIGTVALAQGPGFGRGGYGHGPGYGYHHGNGHGYGPGHWGYGAWGDENSEAWQEFSKLRNDLYAKRNELRSVLAAPEPDRAKAESLQAEINALEVDLNNKRLAAELEYRKNNPDSRWGSGRGYGPGACRR